MGCCGSKQDYDDPYGANYRPIKGRDSKHDFYVQEKYRRQEYDHKQKKKMSRANGVAAATAGAA